MKFTIKSGDLSNQKNCLIVGVFENGELTPSAAKLDKLCQGHIKKILKQGGIEGKSGETLVLYNLPGITAAQVLLVGCGKNKALNETNYRKLVGSAIKAVRAAKSESATFFLTELAVENRKSAWKIKQAAEVTSETLYTFTQFKSEKQPALRLKEITFHVAEKNEVKSCEAALVQAIAISKGVDFTKDLANLPSNICTPAYLADEAKKLAKQYKSISVKILERKDMQKLGMGAFLAVAKGSALDPKLICLEYKGSAKKSKTIALVGKGITFDTGGVSLKPADSMVGMKYDMCGAATVLGTIKAVAELKLPIHVVGLLAAAENMPSGTACKPEDIVTSMSGQTIEIMNTDAEGRLVLCDTLTYSERYKPDAVIDIATLTGAVVIALGHHATGLVSNYEPLAKDLLAAGNESHDRAWQLPLWDEFQEQLKSPFADMSNVGGRSGGTITAGCFLSRFAKKFHWAHLDVAGTAAMMGGNDRYATGRPVPMLTQYLINQSK
jgi:leucyl aminopeptidase